MQQQRMALVSTMMMAVCCFLITASPTTTQAAELSADVHVQAYASLNCTGNPLAQTTQAQNSCFNLGGVFVDILGFSVNLDLGALKLDCRNATPKLSYSLLADDCNKGLTTTISLEGHKDYDFKCLKSLTGSYRIACAAFPPLNNGVNTSAPTKTPTTAKPTVAPTAKPTVAPTSAPSTAAAITSEPTIAATKVPTTKAPTSKAPTKAPSKQPTKEEIKQNQPQTQAQLMAQHCKPAAGIQKSQCNSNIEFCQKNGSSLKWAGAGCRNPNNQKLSARDGGCQCKGYCGYKCATACNADSECTWNDAFKRCATKANPNVAAPFSESSVCN